MKVSLKLSWKSQKGTDALRTRDGRFGKHLFRPLAIDQPHLAKMQFRHQRQLPTPATRHTSGLCLSELDVPHRTLERRRHGQPLCLTLSEIYEGHPISQPLASRGVAIGSRPLASLAISKGYNSDGREIREENRAKRLGCAHEECLTPNPTHVKILQYSHLI